MSSRLRQAARLLVAAASVAMSVTATATIASASESQCINGANGFVDIPDDYYGTSVFQPINTLGGHYQSNYLTLEFATVNGQQRAWAHLVNYDNDLTVGLYPTDQVWMDWTRDNGRTWIQCGPFVPSHNPMWSITSAAQVTSNNPNWKFRAGTNSAGFVTVTPWW